MTSPATSPAYAAQLATDVATPRARQVLGALIAEGAANPELASALRERVVEPRRAELTARMDQEPASLVVSTRQAVDILTGAIYYRALFTESPPRRGARRCHRRRASSSTAATDAGQSDAPEMRIRPIRHTAMPRATTVTMPSRTTALQPSGMPSRTNRSGGSVEQPDERRARQPRRRDLGDAR